MPLAGVGIVVIGRNEGERLRRCLTSAKASGLPIAYADSASTDSSPALARSLGAEVVELTPDKPYTAARGRNEGFERLSTIIPNLRFVQFVDGDCEFMDGWFDHAVAALVAEPKLAVVFGRVRERFPQNSIYNCIADMEWDVPVGEVAGCGGISMMRVEALRQTGLFDPTVGAGEEPELCSRLRERGWKIRRIDSEMVWHDLAVLRFSQWWRRQVRTGYGASDIARRWKAAGPSYFSAQLRSARIWGIGWPVGMIVLAALGVILAGVCGALAGAVLALGVMTLQVLKIARRGMKRGLRPRQALAYGALMMIAKWGELLGQWRFLSSAGKQSSSNIINYKSPEPAR